MPCLAYEMAKFSGGHLEFFTRNAIHGISCDQWQSQDMLTMGLASSKYVVTRYAIDDANKSNEINNIEECLLSNGSFMRHNTCHV
jgi:hypothetical protein